MSWIRSDQGRRTWPLAAYVLPVLLLGGGARLSAQVTYNVFPAAASQDPSRTAQPTNLENTMVTLRVEDSTVAYVIHTLVHQAHLRLQYNIDNPLFTKRITVQIDHEKVMDALGTALHGTGLTARLASDGETIMILGGAADNKARLASGIVIGRVTDSASGQGLSGASVKIAGIKASTVTSDSGNFTLRDIPAGDQVLTVRLFGYKPADRTVTVVDSQRTVVRIIMVSIPTVLSGVVTTATGVQRKIEVGNDITTLNVDSIMHTAPISSVTDLLETRVPGLTIMHSSGEPGAPSRLRLRGDGSITGNNDPVIIIDGIRVYSSQSDSRNQNLAPSEGNNGSSNHASEPTAQYAAPSPIDQLDPSSIETIEVFKGPSASALYGSDAANGVIVITTKHGHSGPTQWTADLGQGVNWIPGSWPTNYFRFGSDLVGQSPLCNWYSPTCLHIDSVRTFQALNDPRYTVFDHGSDQTASLTISGGLPTVQYSLTGTGAKTAGNLKLPAIEQEQYAAAYGSVPGWMVHPDRYSTWGMTGALTLQPYSHFRATVQSSLFNGAQQTSSLQNAITQLEGLYISGNNKTLYNNDVENLTTSPLVENYVEQVTDQNVTSQNVLSLAWTPKAWLPITASGGVQTGQRTDQSYIPFGVLSTGANSCPSGLCSDTTGFYGLGRGETNNQTLTVGTVIPLPRVTLAVGGNMYGETINDFQASTSQLAPGVSRPTSFCVTGNVNCSATQSSSASSTYGWYVEPRLNFQSRFFVAPGFRFDGGSGGTHATTTGGAVGGLSAFPKIDLSYVAVDRQSSHPLWGVLTLLRPRLAFGLAGTQPAPQDRLRLINETYSDGTLDNNDGCSSSYLNGVNTPSACISSLGNTQLRPERSRELEGGLDATLWQGRLTVTYTQYNRTRKDAIVNIPVAPSLTLLGGSTGIDVNIGEVRNTGTELTLNAIVLENHTMSWNVGMNLSNDNNLLVHLNPGQSPNYSLGLVPGYPLFGTWVRPIVSFSDQNHDGIISNNEVVLGDSLAYQGQPNPKYQVNLNTGVTMFSGRLSVTATFAYQNGLMQNNVGALTSGSFLLSGNDPSTPLSYQAAVQAAQCLDPVTSCTGNTSDYGLIQTVNSFRFNDLSINYQLPHEVAAWFKVPRMTMAVQGSNLGLHTNYRGKDPDVNAFTTVSSVDETADLGQVPEPRTWWLKLSLGN